MTVRVQAERGLAAARYALVLMHAQATKRSALTVAKEFFPAHPTIEQAFVQKASVAAGTPASTNWGAEMMPTEIALDFVEAVRPLSVVDRIPGVRSVPFTVPVPKESQAGFGGVWAGEGQPKPLVRGYLDQLQLPRTQAGGIVMFGDEMGRLMRPEHVRAVRDAMVRALAGYLDQQFLDPSVAASANVRPASITSGGTAISSTGSTAAAILVDLKNMLAAMSDDIRNPVWIMRRRDAIYLAGLLTAGNSLMFPTMPNTLLGIPVLISNSIPGSAGSPATDRYVVLVDGSSVLLAEGGVEITATREATLQMDDSPTVTAGASPTATNLVSTFQTNSIATKVMREIHWALAHSTGCAYMQVSW